MTLGEILVSEKTRVSLSIATLLFVIGSTATIVFTIANMRSEIDLSINTLELDQVRIEDKFDEKCTDIEEVNASIIKEQESNRSLMLDTQTDLAEIKTDLKWIRASMERSE